MSRASTIPNRPVGWDGIVDDALRCAREIAVASEAEIREVDEPGQLEAISRMLSLVWNRQVDSRPMTSELLRALAMTGNYVAGAFVGGRLVGAAVAFCSCPPEVTLHSHITGVVSANSRRNVGYALKLHQRAWALQRGIATITWTFDPLVRRNAYFNLAKLGVRATRYLPNFYGAMQDPINAGDDTDRLLVIWNLASLPPSHTEDMRFPPALRVTEDGSPVRCDWEGPGAIIQIPDDIEAIRTRDPGLARAWRLAVREMLGVAMDEGAVVVGFRRDEGYVVALGDRAVHIGG